MVSLSLIRIVGGIMQYVHFEFLKALGFSCRVSRCILRISGNRKFVVRSSGFLEDYSGVSLSPAKC